MYWAPIWCRRALSRRVSELDPRWTGPEPLPAGALVLIDPDVHEVHSLPVGTPWDADTYDRSSQPQQEWAVEVVERIRGIRPDATVLDVGCGTGRVTEALVPLVPQGRVMAMDVSMEMVEFAAGGLAIAPTSGVRTSST